jgi:geranylgeranyl diphosphate synthase, type II
MVAEKILIHEAFEAFLKENEFNSEPQELYEPVNYIMNNNGKRLRPQLLLMTCDMFGGSVKNALSPAFAVELFHNFTLVHDDIMDNAALRRGKSSVHNKYGINTAILSGDVMLSYVYHFLHQSSSQHFNILFRVFNEAAIKIFEGQQIDINFENRMEVDEKEYLKMIEYKTSVLMAAALEMGAIVADATEKQRKLIYQFGLNLGLSFQINDDFLDAFGNHEKVGKKPGGDIIQNKKTFLLITAMNDANPVQRKKFIELFSEKNEQKKINETLQLFDELNIKSKTVNKMHEYFDAACLQ